MKTLDQIGKEMITLKEVFSLLCLNCLPKYANMTMEQFSQLIISNNPSFDPNDPNSKIMSLGTVEVNGKTVYDALFSLKDPQGLKEIGEFVNVEIQGRRDRDEIQNKRENVYLSRMIHEQKNAIEKMEYDQIADVSSIWIYPKTNKKQKGKIIVEARATFDYTEGRLKETNDYDFSMTLVSVYLGETDHPLIQILNLMFDSENGEQNALELKEKYGIILENEVRDMCTLDEYKISLGREEGITLGLAKGLEQGLEQGTLSSLRNLMSSLSIDLKQAMDLLKIKEEDQKKYTELLKENYG